LNRLSRTHLIGEQPNISGIQEFHAGPLKRILGEPFRNRDNEIGSRFLGSDPHLRRRLLVFHRALPSGFVGEVFF
jgi:hypothetical protein